MLENKKNCHACKNGMFKICETLKNNSEYQKIIEKNELFNEEEYNFKDKFICEDFKSIFIEYPITVNEIKTKEAYNLRKSSVGKFVKIRPCKEGYEEKTYLGLFLGELPKGHSISYSSESKELSVGFSMNPAIFVFDLNEIIYGCESWWSIIESEDQLKQITDIDIDNIWYVKALKSFH